MKDGWVYFIREDRADPCGWTKIGWALDPWRRLATIQTGNPSRLILVGKCPGNRVDERIAHESLAAIRGDVGEWFLLGAGWEIIEDWERRAVPFTIGDAIQALREHYREDIAAGREAREARECGALG